MKCRTEADKLVDEKRVLVFAVLDECGMNGFQLYKLGAALQKRDDYEFATPGGGGCGASENFK